MKSDKEQKEFRKIYKTCRRDLYTFCLLLSGEVSAARALTAKTFQTLLPKNPGTDNIQKALYCNAVRNCRVFCREEAPEESPEVELAEEDLSPLPPLSHSVADPAEAIQISTKLTALPFSQRSAVLCFYYAGLSCAEIAAAEGVSESRIRSRIRIAIQNAGGAETMAPLCSVLKMLRKIDFVPKDIIPLREKEKLHRTITFAVTIGIIAFLAVLAGTLTLVRYNRKNRKPESPILSVSEAPSVSPRRTAMPAQAPETPTPSLPPQTPRPGERPILSRLFYNENRYLEYQYEEDTITAKDQTGRPVLVLRFDPEGNLISEKRYEEFDGSFTDRATEWTYDAEGRILKEANYDTGGAAEPTSTITYTYTAEGQLLQTQKVQKGRANPTITTYEYDAKGILRKKVSEEKERNKTEYLYDEAGKLIRITDNSYSFRPNFFSYEYDGDGTLLQSNSFVFLSSANSYVPTYDVWDKTGRHVEHFTEYNGSWGEYYTNYIYDETATALVSIEKGCYSQGTHTYTICLNTESLSIYEPLYDASNRPVPYRFGEKDGAVTIMADPLYESEIGEYSDYTFDRYGNVLRCTYYDKTGCITYVQKYEYDADQKLRREIHYDKYDDAPDAIYCYEYDAKGALSRVIGQRNNDRREYLYQNGNVVQYIQNTLKITYTYDENGSPLGKELQYQEGETAVILSFVFDAKGAPVLQAYWIDDHILSFDPSGKIVQDEHCNFDGTVETVTTYDYDEIGYLTGYTQKTAAGRLLSATEILYDAEKNKTSAVKTLYNADGSVLGQESQILHPQKGMKLPGMEFDRNGDLTKWEGLDAAGTLFNAEFLYIDGKRDEYRLYMQCDPMLLLP